MDADESPSIGEKEAPPGNKKADLAVGSLRKQDGGANSNFPSESVKHDLRQDELRDDALRQLDAFKADQAWKRRRRLRGAKP